MAFHLTDSLDSHSTRQLGPHHSLSLSSRGAHATRVVTGVALLAGIGSAKADSISIGFEPPRTVGSINGQNDWGGQNPPGTPHQY